MDIKERRKQAAHRAASPKIRELEERAAAQDPEAIEAVIKAYRTLRFAVADCLALRYNDGECDSVTLSSLAQTFEDLIEEHEKSED